MTAFPSKRRIYHILVNIIFRCGENQVFTTDAHNVALGKKGR